MYNTVSQGTSYSVHGNLEGVMTAGFMFVCLVSWLVGVALFIMGL